VFLEISYNEHRLPVELTTAGGKRRVVLEGRELECDCVTLPNAQYSIILDGRVYDLSVELSGESCAVAGREGVYTLELRDARRLRPDQDAAAGQEGLQQIRADMPGKVVRVLVRPGDSVAFDQGLLVLEAMKMQNEIRAPKSGVIKVVGVHEGKPVATGEFLISLE